MRRISQLLFLHAGCGTATKKRSTAYFSTDAWKEVRLDISPEVRPDIVGSIVDLEGIADASFDGVFSSHNLEHLYPHEVEAALQSFYRVLKPSGHLVVLCPDLQTVCAAVADGRLLEPLYHSPAGPVAPLDILYGHRPSLRAGHLFMAHRCGFTSKTLTSELLNAGFKTVCCARQTGVFGLCALATKTVADKERIQDLFRRHYPKNA